ncbi:hypothetical protein DPMN_015624 [Dreissena polymorpha]|uniref:Uncharacterized protein n=1 Tax=Dreissena polymorpha TaxID=45954 RepID=A0A9D4NBT3_DREPO|nr:hypothetical protein DPMN_015624 [Dreissena polymorpha]
MYVGQFYTAAEAAVDTRVIREDSAVSNPGYTPSTSLSCQPLFKTVYCHNCTIVYLLVGVISIPTDA